MTATPTGTWITPKDRIQLPVRVDSHVDSLFHWFIQSMRIKNTAAYYRAVLNGNVQLIRSYADGVELMFERENYVTVMEEASLPSIFAEYGCQFVVIRDPSFPFFYGASFYSAELPDWVGLTTVNAPVLRGRRGGFGIYWNKTPWNAYSRSLTSLLGNFKDRRHPEGRMDRSHLE